MDLASFVSHEVLSGILEARSLKNAEINEAEPYKSKYAAADLLEALQHKAAALTGQESDETAARCVTARCKLERGLVLLETDLTCQGQQCLEESLQEDAWPATADAWAIQQQAHNALAALWCDREEFERALKHLDAAAELYTKIQAEQQHSSSNDAGREEEVAEGAPCSDQCSSSGSRWEGALKDVQASDAHYTTTLYYKAQVHGHAGDKQQSAAYCAATLNRQLKQGGFNINEWVQNCVQLSGCFLDCNTFALSQYCCAAVEQLLVQKQEQQSEQATAGKPAAAAAAEAAADLQHCSDQAGLERSKPCTPDEASSRATNAEQQQGPRKDQADKQQQQQAGAAGGVITARLDPALQQLDKDVAANVALGVAKLHLYCLQASHERFVEGRQLQYGFAGPDDVPSVMCFDDLPGLPELRSLRWGDAALAADASSALALFKAALPWFKAALSYYQLDGWVTEHCQILFEMSNLYRCLAGFETDPHKACVMHRQRAKLLQPLEGQLSPRHYPGLSRSISLELGNIFREIADIKAEAAREQDKVAAALAAASRHYQLFLDSFKGDDGGLPAKVEPDMEQHYLAGMSSLARVLPRAAECGPPADRAPMLLRAASLLELLVKYVGDNAVSSREEAAALAQEMAQLLREQVALKQRLTAGRVS